MEESQKREQGESQPPTAAPFFKGDLPNFNAWQLAWELGYTIAVPIVALALVGRWADRQLETSPWLLLAGVVMSVTISSALVYRKIAPILKSQITNPKSQTISNHQNSHDQSEKV